MDITIVGTADPRQRFDALHATRQALGLSVARLCRKADISQSTYQRLVKERGRKPNFRTVKRLEVAISTLDRNTP